jgi:hypothetical protein
MKLPNFLEPRSYKYWLSKGQIFIYSPPEGLLETDIESLLEFIEEHKQFRDDIEIKDGSFLIKKSGVLGPLFDFYGFQTKAANWKRGITNQKRDRDVLTYIDDTPKTTKRRLLLGQRESKQEAIPLSLPSTQKPQESRKIIGFEIEHLADWAGAGWVGTLNPQTGEFFSRVEYDEMLADTEQDGVISLAADHNGYDDNLKAGIEFKTAPCFLRTDGTTPLVEEQLKIIELFEGWLKIKKQELLKDTSLQKLKLRSSKNADVFFDLSIENFLDYYNEHKPKEYQELLKLDLQEPLKWILRLSREDLEQTTPRYSTQINASIPARMIHSQQMRDLFKRKHTYLIENLERKPANPDFHVMQDHEAFLEYEQSVYKKAVALTEAFFKQERDLSKSTRKLEKVKAFLLKIAYEVAMVSTSTEQLMELFSTTSEEYVKTIGKDLFPMGLCKFSSRTFFTEMLSDDDREFILSIQSEKLVEFCESAAELANNSKKQDGMVIKEMSKGGSGKFPTLHFVEYTLKERYKSRANELDPVLMIMERIITPASIATNKHGNRDKKAGVVEFRVPEQQDHSFTQTALLVRESVQRYSEFMDRFTTNTRPKQIDKESKIMNDDSDTSPPISTRLRSNTAVMGKSLKPKQLANDLIVL